MGGDKTLYRHISDFLAGALCSQVEFSNCGTKCTRRELCSCEIHCRPHDSKPQTVAGEIWPQTSAHIKCVGAVVAAGYAGIFSKATICDKGGLVIEYCEVMVSRIQEAVVDQIVELCWILVVEIVRRLIAPTQSGAYKRLSHGFEFEGYW